jgi:hypothetical protein
MRNSLRATAFWLILYVLNLRLISLPLTNNFYLHSLATHPPPAAHPSRTESPHRPAQRQPRSGWPIAARTQPAAAAQSDSAIFARLQHFIARRISFAFASNHNSTVVTSNFNLWQSPTFSRTPPNVCSAVWPLSKLTFWQSNSVQLTIFEQANFMW